MTERIAKYLARAGIASRRDVERMIAEGRVAMNGAKVTHPATFVTEADTVVVDGAAVGGPARTKLWRYHKPAGLVTTHRDPEGRPTVFAALPADLPRVVSVGRLDLASEGLLLLTNDGGLARTLELPSTGWLRRYRVRVYGMVDAERLRQLRQGITVEGVRYAPIEAEIEVEKGVNTWLAVSLHEGKNREIRRVMEAINLKVTRLIRIAYGPFQLGRLEPGGIEEVNPKVLRDQLPKPKGESR